MLLIQINVLFLSFQTMISFLSFKRNFFILLSACFFFIFSSNLCFSGENGITLFSSFLPFKLSWKYSRFRSRVREIVVTFRTWPSMKLTKRKKQEYIDNKKEHILDKKGGYFDQNVTKWRFSEIRANSFLFF